MIVRLKCDYCDIELLHTHQEDMDSLLVCPKCGGRMDIIEMIKEKEIVEVPVPQPYPAPEPPYPYRPYPWHEVYPDTVYYNGSAYILETPSMTSSGTINFSSSGTYTTC